MSFSFTPVFIALFQTQTAIITFILFLGLFVSFVARRQFLSGILLSLFIVKPQFLIPLVIFYFARRQWKILSVFLLCSMMLLGIWYLTAPTHISSYPNFLSWYVSQFENVPNGADKMISIQGLLYQVHAFFPSFPPYAISVFASMLVLGIAARYWYTIHDDTIEVFLTLPPIILLTSGHVLSHEAVLLLFSFYGIFAALKEDSYKFLSLGWIVFLFTYFTPTYPRPLPFLPTL
jgi:hypothetical protein